MNQFLVVLGWVVYVAVACYAVTGLIFIFRAARTGGTVTQMSLFQWALAIACLLLFGMSAWNKIHLLWIAPAGFFVSFSGFGRRIGHAVGMVTALLFRPRGRDPSRSSRDPGTAMDSNDGVFEVAQAVCIPAIRLATLADAISKNSQASSEGLTAEAYTSIMRECIAFLLHCCDFGLYKMLDSLHRSRAMDRMGAMINQILTTEGLWKGTKFAVEEEFMPGITILRGFDQELANARNAEYGRLTKSDGDFDLSIEKFAERVADAVPRGCATDIKTLTTNQGFEYLAALERLLTPAMAGRLGRLGP